MERELDAVSEEMQAINKCAREAENKAIDLLNSLESFYIEDKNERWLQLQRRAALLLCDLRIAHNRRLQPLQAEYAQAWNRKWR